jgi:hypothetical protein
VKKFLLICPTYITGKNQIVGESANRIDLLKIRQTLLRLNPFDRFLIVPSADYRIVPAVINRFAVKLTDAEKKGGA